MVSIFTPAAKAAITVVPKLFTSPCTRRMPKFMILCCRLVRRESSDISQKTCLLQTMSFLEIWKSFLKRQSIKIPTPETYWEMTVAWAAPATPKSRYTTKRMSSTTFIRDERMRKRRGVTESPTALRRAAPKLKRNTAQSPANIHHK